MKKPLIVHPFLFALFPILSLYAHNVDKVSLSQIILPIGAALGITALLFFLLSITFHSTQKGGIITSIFVLLFFFTGHASQTLIQTLPSIKWGGVPLRPLFVLIGFSSILFFLPMAWGILWLRRKTGELRIQSNALNIASVFLVAMTLIPIGTGQLSTKSSASTSKGSWSPPVSNPNVLSRENLPDIYYIVLDGYAHSDTLEDLYGYSNEAFLAGLRQRGFAVVEKGRSNYNCTDRSLSSSLNMEYVHDLNAPPWKEDPNARLGYRQLIKNNRVCRILKARGYFLPL